MASQAANGQAQMLFGAKPSKSAGGATSKRFAVMMQHQEHYGARRRAFRLSGPSLPCVASAKR
jgi:hypothetical protein